MTRVTGIKCDSCNAFFEPEEDQDIFTDTFSTRTRDDSLMVIKLILIVKPNSKLQDLCPKCNEQLIDEMAGIEMKFERASWKEEIGYVS